jgi:hypothetical protein
MKMCWILGFSLLTVTLVGCGTHTPYFLIESRLIENSRRLGQPDVTETPTFIVSRGSMGTVGLQPPDICADQGLSASGGAGQLKLGVLRTHCGVEMAELEGALARAGYHVVSWGAVQHMSTQQEVPLLESARDLGIDVLLQANALERIEILVDCQDPGCCEIKRLRPVSADGPADEYQAIFHDLVRSLVTDLAERFAGRRS